MLGLDAPLSTLALSVAGGLLGAVLLLPLLYFMREGLTPAYVYAAARRRNGIEDVTFGQALSAYLLAATGLGTVFGIVYLAVDLVPYGWVIPPVAGAATITSVIYFLFTRLVLPLVELDVHRRRLLKIQLVASSFLYGLVLMVLVPSLALAM